MRLVLATQTSAPRLRGPVPCVGKPLGHVAPRTLAACTRGGRAAATKTSMRHNVVCGATAATSIPDSPSTAKTIVDLAAYGTLSTLSADNQLPLGTYVTYVLDQVGQPILRLRKDAIHTQNLMANPRCSLFVQPADYPAHLLARVTLIGSVEPVSAEIAESAAALHRTLHSGGVGVDEPRDDDLYYRMVVDECFYVGQLSGESAAEVVPGDAYRNAEADPMRTFASSLVKSMNEDRLEDVIRVCAQEKGVGMDDIYYGEMAWIDKKGVYMRASVGSEQALETIRVAFDREVIDERDARSALTMIAQVSWEKDKPYQPVPVAVVREADAVET
jgi:putative heme iron utilization protein